MRNSLLASVSLCVMIGTAHAQNAQTTSLDQSAQNAAVSDTIVVSARKRDEDVTDIPDQVAVFNASTIENAGIDSVEDVTLQIPNFSLVNTQNPGTVFLNLRGIGQYRNAEAPVAIVIDGVQLVSTDAITQELYDVQQIEVLKGPQGALFGRNASAGAINIITKKPGNEFEGSVEATYANGGDVRARASISGPIIEDMVYARLSGSFRRFDGVIDNVTTGAPADFYDDENLRLRVIAEPLDWASFDFRASYSNLHAGSSYFASILDEGGFALNGVVNDFRFPVQTDTEGVSDRELQEYALKADFDLGFATLTSVTAYSKTTEDFFQDLDFTAAPVLTFLQDRTVKGFSEEIRLVSNATGPFSWLVGGYILDSERELGTNVFGSLDNVGLYNGADFTNGNLSLFDFNLTTAAADTLFVNLRNLEDNFAWAVFGNFDYAFTDQLTLTFGIRYDRDNRDQIDLVDDETLSETFSLPQPKVQLSYQPRDGLNIYGSWGRGFRSGGFNQSDVIQASYAAEEVSTGELGFKSNWLDQALTVNGAIFRTKFENRQDFIFLQGFQNVLTFPEAEILGAELEIAAKPTDNLDFFVSGGVLDTQIQSEAIGFDTSTIAGLGPDFSFIGNDIPLVYGWSYTIGATHRMDLSNGMTVTSRIDYSGRGDLAWEVGNQDRQSAVHLVNARVSLGYEGFKLTAWVENLGNEDYYQEFVAREFSELRTDLGFPASPRRYGVSAAFNF